MDHKQTLEIDSIFKVTENNKSFEKVDGFESNRFYFEINSNKDKCLIVFLQIRQCFNFHSSKLGMNVVFSLYNLSIW